MKNHNYLKGDYFFNFFSITLLIINFTNSHVNYRRAQDVLQQNNFLQSSMFICNSSLSCSNQGVCLNSTHCECYPGYFTLFNYEINPHYLQCNYAQKSKKTAFLLSFFLGPLSFDSFYLGNDMLGYFKLILPSILILIGITLFVVGKSKSKLSYQIVGRVIEFIATIIIIIWWFVDWIMIVSNAKKDLNDIELY